MNISSIADMIRADPTIPSDVSGYVSRMNLKNISRVVTTRTVVAETTVVESIADAHGGRCTARDVQEAIRLLNREPLATDIEARAARVRAAVEAGTVTTLAEARAEFGR